eukprot:776629-Amphidinium_carterae.1
MVHHLLLQSNHASLGVEGLSLESGKAKWSQWYSESRLKQNVNLADQTAKVLEVAFGFQLHDSALPYDAVVIRTRATRQCDYRKCVK